MRRLAIAIACSAIAAQPVSACAPAPHINEPVYVREESALIVWHPESQTEDFVRQASFYGRTVDFGFLVPTPSVPELTAVQEQLMTELADATAPKIVREEVRSYDFTPLIMLIFGAQKRAAIVTTAAPQFEVLRRQEVGHYEAVVLRATDPASIDSWLRDHQYDASPDLKAWLEPYVKAGWIITAFKIKGDETTRALDSSLVKMTFRTDRPFFPYREPQSQRTGAAGDRVLRVWFASPERVQGSIGDARPWPGKLSWSNTLDETARRSIEITSRIDLGSSTRLTAFIDKSSPRPGVDDLYFTRSQTQTPVIPPPVTERIPETVHVPSDVIGVAVLATGLGTRWLRRVTKEK